MSIALLVIGLLLFVGLVVVHEFGHFIMARRNGVDVEEFGIGFPPRAKVLTKKNGTVYTLNWLPLGGFVKLKGEHDADTTPGSFGAASIVAKIKIMVAGVALNLVTAYVLLIGLALIGIPKLIDNQFSVPSDTKVVQQQVLVGRAESNSPASKAGIQQGDELAAIGLPDGAKDTIRTSQNLPQLTAKYAGKKVDLLVRRDGQPIPLQVQLRDKKTVTASKKTADPQGYLGITPLDYTVERSTWSAPIVAGGVIKQFTQLTFKGLGDMVTNLFRGQVDKATEQVSGPVGIFVVLKDGSMLGYRFILMVIAIISLTLAIMNVLPIPALDGGRLFVLLLFRALKKPLTKEREEMIHGSGFAALMLLFVLITIVDIRRFF